MKAVLLVATASFVQGVSAWTDVGARKLLFGPTLTDSPTVSPTTSPTYAPTEAPTYAPTEAPTYAPTKEPTKEPTYAPTEEPTYAPTKAPTEAPTIGPLPVGLNFDIFTLSTVGGGGRPYQYAGLYDTNWELRDAPLEKYEMRYSWNTKSTDRFNNFGDFIVRDQTSKVFPTNSPPITDGFGTWTVTASTAERDEFGSLPDVPAEYAICQQESALILGGTGGPRNPNYCQATNDESLVYGTPIGALAAADFAYIFDFCTTGLRGGRDYRVWFSPIDTRGRVPDCPFLCDPLAPTFVRTNVGQPWYDETGSLRSGLDDIEHMCYGLDFSTFCTNKLDDSDGVNGKVWYLASMTLSSGGWPVPRCCEYGTTIQQPTVQCTEASCVGADRTDLVTCN